jgi:hypothetical protein
MMGPGKGAKASRAGYTRASVALVQGPTLAPEDQKVIERGITNVALKIFLLYIFKPTIMAAGGFLLGVLLLGLSTMSQWDVNWWEWAKLAAWVGGIWTWVACRWVANRRYHG